MSTNGDTAVTSVGRAALAYAVEFGWPVFPCHTVDDAGRCSCGNPRCDSSGKHPRTGRGFQDASTDPDIIAEWWHRWPTANVAIPMGALSGLIAVDVDSDAGGEALRRICGHPPTTTVLTGNGYHLLFRHPGEPVAPKVGLEDGLDIRGDGSYIIVPPSRHYSGKEYRFDRERGLGPKEAGFAPLPPKLLERIKAAATSEGNVTERLEAGDPIPKGGRDNEMVSVAGKLIAGGLSAEATFQTVSSINRDRCQPPLSDAQVRKCVASAVRMDRGNYPERYMDDSVVEDTPRFVLVRMDDTTTTVEPTDLVQGLIPGCAFGYRYAKSGDGKSAVELALAWHLVLGEPFLGHPVQQGHVILCVNEGQYRIHGRIRAWADAHDIRLSGHRYAIWVVKQPLNLTSPIDVEALATHIRDRVGDDPVALISVDTLSGAIGGAKDTDEDAALSTTVNVHAHLIDPFGTTCQLLHHTGWNRARERGTTYWHDKADFVVRQTLDGQQVKLTCDKQRDIAPFDPQYMELKSMKPAGLLKEYVFAVPGEAGAPERITKEHIQMLEVLDDLAELGSYTRWLSATRESNGISEATFARRRKWLLSEAYIIKPKEQHNGRYQLTPKGAGLLSSSHDAVTILSESTNSHMCVPRRDTCDSMGSDSSSQRPDKTTPEAA